MPEIQIMDNSYTNPTQNSAERTVNNQPETSAAVRDLISMATLSISLSAAALATNYTTSSDNDTGERTSEITYINAIEEGSVVNVASGHLVQKKDSVRYGRFPNTTNWLKRSRDHRKSLIEIISPLTSAKHCRVLEESRLGEGRGQTSQPGEATLASDMTSSKLGYILLGLRYDLGCHLLTVAVGGCRGLVLPSWKQGNIDWYVKLYLRPSQRSSLVKKRRTSKTRAFTDPDFYELFHFHTGLDMNVLEAVLCSSCGTLQKEKILGRVWISLQGLGSLFTGRTIIQSYQLGRGKRIIPCVDG